MLATAVAAWVFLVQDESYTVHVRFQAATNVVKGNLVQVAGRKVGIVEEIELTPNGEADLTLKITDDAIVPLRTGTRATLRIASLSGSANRYVDLRIPPAGGRELKEGETIHASDTTSAVEVDQLFQMFDSKTRKGLRSFIRGQATQWDGKGELANNGWNYVNPAVVAASRLFRELDYDTKVLEEFVVNSSRAGHRRRRPPRRPRRARRPARRHDRRDRPRGGRPAHDDRPAAAVHAPRQLHVRGPPGDARRPRPRRRGVQAGHAEAARRPQRAAAVRRGGRADRPRPVGARPLRRREQRPDRPRAERAAAARRRRAPRQPQRQGAAGQLRHRGRVAQGPGAAHRATSARTSSTSPPGSTTSATRASTTRTARPAASPPRPTRSPRSARSSSSCPRSCASS